MLFVVHAADKNAAIQSRAKLYRDHRIHLDKADDYEVSVLTAGTLLAEDLETPIGSVFIVDAKDRAAVNSFVKSDPYHVSNVWETVQIHGYSRKRGTPITSQRAA